MVRPTDDAHAPRIDREDLASTEVTHPDPFTPDDDVGDGRTGADDVHPARLEIDPQHGPARAPDPHRAVADRERDRVARHGNHVAEAFPVRRVDGPDGLRDVVCDPQAFTLDRDRGRTSE